MFQSIWIVHFLHLHWAWNSFYGFERITRSSVINEQSFTLMPHSHAMDPEKGKHYIICSKRIKIYETLFMMFQLKIHLFWTLNAPASIFHVTPHQLKWNIRIIFDTIIFHFYIFRWKCVKNEIKSTWDTGSNWNDKLGDYICAELRHTSDERSDGDALSERKRK